MPRWVTFNTADGAQLPALVGAEHAHEHLDLLVFSTEQHESGIGEGVSVLRNIGRGDGPVSWKPRGDKP